MSRKKLPIRSRSSVFSMISGDKSRFVIGDVNLPRSNHSSKASRSYENPSAEVIHSPLFSDILLSNVILSSAIFIDFLVSLFGVQ